MAFDISILPHDFASRLSRRSRHGTQISCLGSKHTLLLISLSSPFPVYLQHNIVYFAAAAHICINTLFHQPTRRDYPHDHGAPVSDQRQCSPILTSISWSSATFKGLTGPSLSLFMTSWSRIGF